MSEWWSIEVFDGRFPASSWRNSWGKLLLESALTHGADGWEWHSHDWGLVLEVAFQDEHQWDAWRTLPGTQAALDAVPDPVNGLVIYPGRGGSSGTPIPRRPRPAPGSAAIDLEPPKQERVLPMEAADPSTEPTPTEPLPSLGAA